MSKFHPATGYIEVEPYADESIILTDSKKLVEKARVIEIPEDAEYNFNDLKINDIVFFRPHGCFELTEHEGKKRWVLNLSEEFVLGYVRSN